MSQRPITKNYQIASNKKKSLFCTDFFSRYICFFIILISFANKNILFFDILTSDSYQHAQKLHYKDFDSKTTIFEYFCPPYWTGNFAFEILTSDS